MLRLKRTTIGVGEGRLLPWGRLTLGDLAHRYDVNSNPIESKSGEVDVNADMKTIPIETLDKRLFTYL